MANQKHIFILLFVFFNLTLLASNEKLPRTSVNHSFYEHSLKLESYFDTSNKYTNPLQLVKDSILKPEYLSKSTFYKGYKTQNLWFKLVPGHFRNKKYVQFNNAFLDNIIVYKFKNQQITDSIVTGDSHPFNTRQYPVNTFMFSLDTSSDFYIVKVNTNGMLSVPIVFYSEQDVMQNKHFPSFIYFGIILLATIFNLLLIIRFKESIYVYYFGSLFSIGFIIATDWGFSFQFLWPNLPQLNNYSIIAYNAIFFLLLFSEKFLEIRKFVPSLYKVFISCYILLIGNTIITLLGFYNLAVQISLYLTLVLPVFCLFSGIRIYKHKKQLSVVFFISGFIFYSFFIVIYLLSYMDVISVNVFTKNSVQIANTCEIVFLFLAVIERFRFIELQKKKADKQLLEITKRNKEILEEQNSMLEKKVVERIIEIKELNDKLAATNKELTNSNEELSTINQYLEDQKITLSNTIAQLKETQSQLIQSEKMAALGTLVAGVAHEINNPLNFIAGGLNLINNVRNSKTGSTQPWQKQLEMPSKMIQDGINRATNIVKALMTYSHKTNSQLSYFDIHKILDNTLLFLKSKIDPEIKVVKIYTLERQVPVFADKMHQVFLNIIDNALFAIKNSSDQIENKIIITTLSTIEKKQEFAVVKIFNSGSTIEEKSFKKLYDPFYSTKETGQGTGLGLFICYNIIEEHKGIIYAENTDNGVCFTIKLPILSL